MLSFYRVPDEMRAYRQWIVWKLEDRGGPKPTKVPYSPFGAMAAVDRPGTWGTFDDAIAAYERGGFSGVGFVLTEHDPYVFVDLDDTKGDEEALQRQFRIFHELVSYAERSPSGNGLHIIAKGKLPGRGRKRADVELYDKLRFMTMTGDIYRDAAIVDCNDALALLWHQMGGPAAIHHYEADQPQREDDNVVIDRARNAENGPLFVQLYEGDWQALYPSQSEADQALVNILAFYSQNRAQIERIWGYSQLGKRDKFKRSEYRTWTINKSFDMLLPPVDTSGLAAQFEAMLAKEAATDDQYALPGFVNINGVGIGTENGAAPEGPSTAPPPSSFDAPPGRDAIRASAVVAHAAAPVNGPSTIIVPPGLVGAVCDFIYDAAPRPVREIALVGALGFVAGIVGRSYNVSATGLNLYTLLLAPTGTGKEAINAGISKLIAAVRPTVQTIDDFVGPAEIRSDAALLKWIAKKPCFLTVTGEFGLRLKQMAAPNAPPSEVGLKRVLLDLFNKSGQGNALNPIAYSDKEKNTDAIRSPSFSMIGETTPERFYDALDESMIAEGLLPRFLTIEYNGKRPPLSDIYERAQPSLALMEMVQTIVVHAQKQMSANQVTHVTRDLYADALFKDFDAFCDDQINSDTAREVVRHMWNRAHIKALKLAALVAVGVNPFEPIIDLDCARWATDIVVRDVRNIIDRFERGDIGSGFGANESRQINDVLKVVRDWLSSPAHVGEKYGLQPAMHAQCVISYSALSKRTLQLASFRADRLSPTAALKRTIQLMLDSDILRELPKNQMADKFNSQGRGFVVSDVSAFKK